MSTSPLSRSVAIAYESAQLEGMLGLPKSPRAVVLFAHGSGSSRLSPRNNYVASVLRDAGIGTLLLDLLTPHEDRAYQNRFDIALLAERLEAAAKWLRMQPETASLPLGLFGASTGAAAALRTAVALASSVFAVVSRGGGARRAAGSRGRKRSARGDGSDALDRWGSG
jgi:putative phosphoribosyl transferase